MFRVNRGSLCSSSNHTSFEVSLLWRIQGGSGVEGVQPPPPPSVFFFFFFTNVNMTIQRLVYWVYIRSILRLGSLLFLVQSTVYIYLKYIHVRIHLLVHFIYELSVLNHEVCYSMPENFRLFVLIWQSSWTLHFSWSIGSILWTTMNQCNLLLVNPCIFKI